MRDLVGGEKDGVVAEESIADYVAEGVVFFGNLEDGRVGNAWIKSVERCQRGSVR